MKKSVILLSCEEPKIECLLLRKYSENIREESSIKKSEAGLNLFPRNLIAVQAYPVTVDSV